MWIDLGAIKPQTWPNGKCHWWSNPGRELGAWSCHSGQIFVRAETPSWLHVCLYLPRLNGIWNITHNSYIYHYLPRLVTFRANVGKSSSTSTEHLGERSKRFADVGSSSFPCKCPKSGCVAITSHRESFLKVGSGYITMSFAPSLSHHHR